MQWGTNVHIYVTIMVVLVGFLSEYPTDGKCLALRRLFDDKHNRSPVKEGTQFWFIDIDEDFELLVRSKVSNV